MLTDYIGCTELKYDAVVQEAGESAIRKSQNTGEDFLPFWQVFVKRKILVGVRTDGCKQGYSCTAFLGVWKE